MLSQNEEQLKQRVESWCSQLNAGQVIKGLSTIGGGSLPGETLPTFLLQLSVKSPNKLLKALRENRPAIIARIQDGSLVLDPRTVHPDEDKVIINSLKHLVK